MDVAGEARALSGILALARTRRAALEIHDPSRLFTATQSLSQLGRSADAIATDAARAVDLLGETSLLAGDDAVALARHAASLKDVSTPAARRNVQDILTILDRAFAERLPADAKVRGLVEGRVRELVRGSEVLDDAGKAELSLLALEAGTASRLGLARGIARDVYGSADHVLRHSPDEFVGRLREAWAAQLAAPADALVDEVRTLVRDEGITPANAARLRTLAMDAGIAAQLRLPRTLPRVGQAEDVLGRVAASEPLESADELARWRLERMWQRTLLGDVPTDERLGAELAAALADPIERPEQSRELLHVLDDLRGGRQVGVVDGSDLATHLFDSFASHARGTGDVASAEFARWRLLVRMDEELARRAAGDAADALRTPHGDAAPSVALLRADPHLRLQLDAGDRLGALGATPPADLPGIQRWIGEVDEAMAVRSDVPDALRADIDRLRSRIHGFVGGHAPDDAPIGYRNHPDYAEVGRLGEQLRLADLLVGAEARTPTAQLADSLPW